MQSLRVLGCHRHCGLQQKPSAVTLNVASWYHMGKLNRGAHMKGFLGQVWKSHTSLLLISHGANMAMWPYLVRLQEMLKTQGSWAVLCLTARHVTAFSRYLVVSATTSKEPLCWSVFSITGMSSNLQIKAGSNVLLSLVSYLYLYIQVCNFLISSFKITEVSPEVILCSLLRSWDGLHPTRYVTKITDSTLKLFS